MENNILFVKNKYPEDFDITNNKLVIKNKQNAIFNVTLDDDKLNTLNIEVINSNVFVIINYLNNNKLSLNINVDKESRVDLLSLFIENKDYVLNRIVNNQNYFKSMQIDLNSNNISINDTVNMDFEGGETIILDGIYANQKAKKNYQTCINHFAPHTYSKVQIFAVNNDFASCEIKTDAFIKNKANGVNASQEGRIINITDTCYGIVLPDLHIDENDVQASHSCSVGSINLDHLYYLQTRGFNLKDAKKILIKGYFVPILSSIEDEKLKEKINDILLERLN